MVGKMFMKPGSRFSSERIDIKEREASIKTIRKQTNNNINFLPDASSSSDFFYYDFLLLVS